MYKIFDVDYEHLNKKGNILIHLRTKETPQHASKGINCGKIELAPASWHAGLLFLQDLAVFAC